MDDRQYIVVIKETPQDLILEVNKSLKLGWIPLGGAVVIPGTPLRWMQTLVKQS